jgi:Lon protease-like protein
MFPLSAVLFPHASMPLHVFEPRYRALMRDCLEGDSRFGVVLKERGSEVGGGDHRSALGTRGVIAGAAELPDGRWVLEVRGEAVVEIDQWLPDDPYPLALVTERAGPGGSDVPPGLDVATQRVRRARALLAEHGGPPCPPMRLSTAAATPTWRPGSSAGRRRSTPTTRSDCWRPVTWPAGWASW